MKRLISLFLFMVMLVCSTVASDTTAFANDSVIYSISNKTSIDEYSIPNPPNDFAITKIGPTTISLSWFLQRSNTCNGFEISRYNTSQKKYTHLAYVKYSGDLKTYNYTLKGFKKNTKYTLAVRAYIEADGKKYFGKYTSKLGVSTSPSEALINTAKYVSAGKMKVSWKKVSNVSGYIIKYSTNSGFKDNGTTCTLVVPGASNSSKTISGLANKKYYVKICTYKSIEKVKYCSDYSRVKTVNVKKGASLKAKLNAVKTDNSGRKYIKQLTNNGVDINKYKTTYDKVRAIYIWHAKHNTDNNWDCVGCNSNFNSCIAALFQGSNKRYDGFVVLEAGDVKNSNGRKVMHKWSVIYLAGTPYIFDPRLQGYTGNNSGTAYFGITKNSKLGKKYIYDYRYGTWHYNKDSDYYPFYTNGFVNSVKKPKIVKVKKATAQKGGMKLSWTKVNSAKGYQIQYSKSKKFSSSKSVFVDNADSVSKTISGLDSKRTYYVRIRAYKVNDKSKIYGFWSSCSTVKTK